MGAPGEGVVPSAGAGAAELVSGIGVGEVGWLLASLMVVASRLRAAGAASPRTLNESGVPRPVPSVVTAAGRYTPGMARIRRSEDLPFGVVVVAFGFLLNAFLFVLALAGVYGTSRIVVEAFQQTPFIRPVFFLLMATEILTALFLLRRHPIGWVLAMLLACISLAFLLVLWSLGSPEYIRMPIFSAMALYLNQREVRTAFAWHPRDDHASTVDDHASTVDEEGAGAA